jgi:hypothetical protein
MGTDLHFRTSLQPAHIRAPPAIGHDSERRHVLTPLALATTYVHLLLARCLHCLMRWNREGLADAGGIPATEDGQKRAKIEGYRCLRILPRMLITDRRGSAWRLFVPIPSSCSSHEHSRGSNVQTATIRT